MGRKSELRIVKLGVYTTISKRLNLDTREKKMEEKSFTWRTPQF